MGMKLFNFFLELFLGREEFGEKETILISYLVGRNETMTEIVVKLTLKTAEFKV